MKNSWTENIYFRVYSYETKNMGGNRGLFFSSYNITNAIEYITISTLCNGTFFGQLTGVTTGNCASVSNRVRSFTGGGNYSGFINAIQYNTFATLGNSIDFSDLTVAKGRLSSCGNETVGLWNGGTMTSAIDYITFATQANATSFGIDTIARDRSDGSGNSEIGLFIGGVSVNTTSKVVYSNKSNATSFGTLLLLNYNCVGASSNFTDRVIVNKDNTIEYITIPTNANSVNFGSMTNMMARSVSNGTRVVFGGSDVTMQYVTISILSNALNFGNLVTTRYLASACSGD